MDVKKRWSKKEKSLKSDPAPENTQQNTKILVNDLFFLYSFSYEIFVTWKFELFSQCFFTVVCLSSMLMHCNASTWVPINVNPQGLATFFGPHLPLYCTCNISCYESSSEIYSMEIKISLSVHKESDKWESDKSDGGLRIAVAGVHLDSERFAWTSSLHLSERVVCICRRHKRAGLDCQPTIKTRLFSSHFIFLKSPNPRNLLS